MGTGCRVWAWYELNTKAGLSHRCCIAKVWDGWCHVIFAASCNAEVWPQHAAANIEFCDKPHPVHVLVCGLFTLVYFCVYTMHVKVVGDPCSTHL